MACNCLIDARKQLVEETHDENLFLDAPIMLNFKTGVETQKAGSLYFHYHKKKKDGTFEKKLTKSFLSFEYCPLCGTKY